MKRTFAFHYEKEYERWDKKIIYLNVEEELDYTTGGVGSCRSIYLCYSEKYAGGTPLCSGMPYQIDFLDEEKAKKFDEYVINNTVEKGRGLIWELVNKTADNDIAKRFFIGYFIALEECFNSVRLVSKLQP